ncbi:MAG: sugar transferase [Deltaproteobacteria bacterium]|nr:sugar transferase [Deltaproteobacteria bacterium]
MFRRHEKRLFDLALTIPGFVLISPIVWFIALLVRTDLGSPVLFRQVRPGLKGKPFTIYKFRTMTDERDLDGNLLLDSQRLTALGRFLRATSLDELPELWNVVKGDMSIVGPRPLLIQYLERYTPEQARRHEVKPGLTGWAQVNGRNALSWEEKFEMDVWYVAHWSLWLDLKIIGMTMVKVLKREGISAEGEATMPEFNPQITQITQKGKFGKKESGRFERTVNEITQIDAN